jgi:uncharacterized membrane protein
MTRLILGFTGIILAVFTGFFPFIFYIKRIDFGITIGKSSSLLSNPFWKFPFHTHFIFAAISLLTGWPQFIPKFRKKHPASHSTLGKTYIICTLFSAIAGIYIGFFATGGFSTKIGFITLGFIWLFTSLKGYQKIRQLKINEHQQMMIYSYATCFAGVTLRIELPILELFFDRAEIAYAITAWLCWIPNLMIAYLINKT